ncbi:ROK family protein [Herbiconiux liukaitaii]|uniref:ROK family protein n=1 Tax=Herbiconiux liukaitaii TaxID=3342799 RepID=UPI0035B8E418
MATITPAHAPSPAGDPPASGRSGGNLDDLRRRNLSSILQAVHVRDGCTRAELTHETGLNRSTVRALVADLEQAGVVFQREPASSGGVGRPSPSVHASDAVRVLAINPEVDATAGAIVGLGGRVLARARVAHAQSPSPADVIEAVGELRRILAPEGGLRGIGVAVPGLINKSTGDVVIAPHLGWQNVPLTELLTSAEGIRVVIDNDANCGVMAESLFGAGRGLGTMVYLNGGASGIGGSAMTDGSLLAGAHGYAGEFGHTLVNTVGRPCDCGAAGCLETEVTRAGLLAALGGVAPDELERELVRRSEEDRARLAENAADMGEPCTGTGTSPSLSPASVEADRQLRYLGIALRTVVNVMNPERVLLGGFLASMVNARGMQSLEAELAHALPGAKNDVQVVTAELGGDILAVGAAQLVLRHVIDDPLGTRLAPQTRAPAARTA